MRFGFYLIYNWEEGERRGPTDSLTVQNNPGKGVDGARIDRGKPPHVALEGFAGEKITVGRENFRFLLRDGEMDSMRISRQQFVASVVGIDGTFKVKLEDLSSNSTYVNGKRLGKGAAPLELSHGDKIGLVTNPQDRRQIILGLLFCDEREGTPRKEPRPSTALTTTPTAPPAPTNPEDAANRTSVASTRKRARGTDQERTVPISPADGAKTQGSFGIWNGLLRLKGSKDGPLYACYALPASMQSIFPPPWESWPSTIDLQSRHRTDDQQDRVLMEKFVAANKPWCFAFLSLHGQNAKLEHLAEELSKKREFFSGTFQARDDVEDKTIKKYHREQHSQPRVAQMDYLITVKCVLSRSQHSTLPMHDRAIIGFFSTKSAERTPDRTANGALQGRNGAPWTALKIFVRSEVPLALQLVVLNLVRSFAHSKDREILKDLIITATEGGALDVASETVKPLRYPCVNNDVNVIFVPEDANAFTAFAWTLNFRLVPRVKIVALNARPIPRTALQKGPLELLRRNHGRELFRRGGLIFVDGAYLIENLNFNVLGRLHAALVRYNTLVEGEQWTLLFRNGELKSIVDLSKFSQMTASSVLEPLRMCSVSPAAMRALGSPLELSNVRATPENGPNRCRLGLHVVDDSWPNRSAMNELFNGADWKTAKILSTNFRYILALGDTRDVNSTPSDSLSTASITQEPGLGIQRMNMDAMELWLEGLRHSTHTD